MHTHSESQLQIELRKCYLRAQENVHHQHGGRIHNSTGGEGGGGRQGGCLAGWQLLPFVCFVSRLPKMESRLSGGGQVIAIVISQRSKSNCLHCLACLPKMHTHTHTCNTPHNTDYTLPTLEHCLDARYTCALFAC